MSLILQEFISVYCLVNIPFNLHLEISKASVMLFQWGVSIGAGSGRYGHAAISDSDVSSQLFVVKGYLFCILRWTRGRTCHSHESEARASLTWLCSEEQGYTHPHTAFWVGAWCCLSGPLPDFWSVYSYLHHGNYFRPPLVSFPNFLLRPHRWANEMSLLMKWKLSQGNSFLSPLPTKVLNSATQAPELPERSHALVIWSEVTGRH